MLDEELARTVAKVYGVKIRGSVFLLFKFMSLGALTKQKLKETIDEMIAAGWRCSPKLYGEVMKHINDAPGT